MFLQFCTVTVLHMPSQLLAKTLTDCCSIPLRTEQRSYVLTQLWFQLCNNITQGFKWRRNNLADVSLSSSLMFEVKHCRSWKISLTGTMDHQAFEKTLARTVCFIFSSTMRFNVTEGAPIGANLKGLCYLMRCETLETCWRHLSVHRCSHWTGQWGVNKSPASKTSILLWSVDATPSSHAFPVFMIAFLCVPHPQCFIRGGEDVAARWSDHKLQWARQSGWWKESGMLLDNILLMASDIWPNLQKVFF